MRAFLAIVTAAAGLHGSVTKGPTMPVCHAGTPCTAPAQVTLLFRNTRTERTFRTRSTAKGAYRIVLAPGFYTVTTPGQSPIGRGLTPRAVHVRAHHDDRLDFSIDTGIR